MGLETAFPGEPTAYLADGEGRLVCLDVRAHSTRDSISRRANAHLGDEHEPQRAVTGLEDVSLGFHRCEYL